MLRRFPSLLVISSLLFALLPMSFSAAAGPSYVTRAQFVEALDQAMGISPVYPSTPDFSDVPASSPYYGYIEAAYRAGIIAGVGSGRFDPNGLLTRAQVAKIEVAALGLSAAALALNSKPSGFSDNGTIPSWARGYVDEAVSLGLVKGYPNNTFQPGQTLTTSDETFFISQVKSTASTSIAPASMSLSADATDVGIGQQVTLTASVRSASGAEIPGVSVTYSTSSPNAIVGAGKFVADEPGNYTVTATTANGVSASTVISVYGSAVALRIIQNGSIVADGQDKVTLQVQAVDINGNIDQSATGSIALYYISAGGATSALNGLGASYVPTTVATAVTDGITEPLTNGAAAFSLRAGTIPGASDTVEAVAFTGVGTVLSSPTDGQLALTSTKPVPTSIAVSGPSTIATNVGEQTASLSVQVVDQAGFPMLSGAYAIAIGVTGPATLSGGTNQETFSYIGSGLPLSPNTLSVPVTSTGTTGMVTVTLSSSGLPPQSVQLSAVNVGPAVAIRVTAPATASFPESNGNVGLTYGVSEVDSNGNTVPNAGSLRIEVERNGAIAYNIRVDGYTQTSTGVIDTTALSKGQFTVTDMQGGPDAGTYQVLVSDPNGILAAPPALSFTETPGSPTTIALTSASEVPVTAPSTTVTATLKDAYGNNTETSGIAITFTNDPGNSTPGVMLSSSTATTVDGVASVTATAPVYENNTYSVDASAPGLASGKTSFTVVVSVVTNMTVAFKDVARGGDSAGTYVDSTTIAQASDTVTMTIAAVNAYDQPTGGGNSIQINLSSTGLVPEYSTGGALSKVSNTVWTDKLSSSGTDTITCIAETAGAVSVAVTDTSLSNVSTGSQSMEIEPGNVWNYVVLTTSGVNATTVGVNVPANTSETLNVSAVDEYGNTAVLTASSTIYLSDNPTGGTFSLLPNGQAVTSVSMVPGESTTTVYYRRTSTDFVHLYATP